MRRARVYLTAAVTAVVLVGGCGGGGGETPDGPAPDSDPACGAWTVAPGVASGLELYDPAPLALGRTVRVGYDAELAACEDLAMPGVEQEIGTNLIVVEPRVMRQVSGTCTTPARTVQRIVELVTAVPGTFMVRLANTEEAIAVTIGPEPSPACSSARSPCEADCDCDQSVGERCLGVNVGNGPETACVVPCEVDRDCNGRGRCSGDLPGGFPFVCETEPECDAGRPCPTGYTCSASACTPTFTLGADTRHECTCDAECDPGLRCVRPYDTSAPSRCQAMCPTDGPWCAGPGAHGCGDLTEDLAGLAGTDAVCVFYGE